MTTDDMTVPVRLTPEGKRQLDAVATLTGQSAETVASMAVQRHTREILLNWAVTQHRARRLSLGELARETGLDIVEIMDAISERGLELCYSAKEEEAGHQMFLAAMRSVAELTGDADVSRRAEHVVEEARARSTPAETASPQP